MKKKVLWVTFACVMALAPVGLIFGAARLIQDLVVSGSISPLGLA